MRLQTLEIKKFRSFLEPFYLQEPGKLHLFIGANNAGKTNILDAFHLFMSDDVRIPPDAEVTVAFTIDDGITGTLVAKLHHGQREYTFQGAPITAQRGRELLTQRSIRLCATSPLDRERVRRDLQQFRNIDGATYKIFCDTLATHIPQIEITDTFFDAPPDHVTPGRFDNLGAGFQQVFVMLMYLFHPTYTLLLIEEPEIHLHPALVGRVLDIMERHNLYNQIFITTHSPIFIHPQNLHRVFRVTHDAMGTHVFSPRLEGKQLDYQRLTQELNAENCEMFFADVVLLVEGQSDHILMRGLIDRFYNGTKDIKVIQVYGKSNIDIYAELLAMFKIPYVVLLDRDALYDAPIETVQRVTRGQYGEPEEVLITRLRQHKIFVLPQGSIERHYPRRYQRRHQHKTQNAHYAAQHLSERDYRSNIMEPLRAVVEAL